MRSQLLKLVGLIKSFRKLNDLLRYNPILYPRIAATIRTIEQTNAYNRYSAIRPLLSNALKNAQHTPYGKEKDRTLDHWPILQKAEVKANASHFQTRQWLTVPAATSGSSGVPLQLKRSLKNIAAEQAFLDALLSGSAPPLRQARTAVLRGNTVKDPADQQPPFGVYQNESNLVLSLFHLNERSAGWFISELEKFRPEVLWVYPTGGDFLASQCLQRNVKLNIPIVLSSSEVLAPESWERLRKAFGGNIVDYYGQAERVCLSYQHQPNEAWFHPAYGFVELFPDEAELGDGLRRAKIVATGYWNDKMPLVRYDTGDYAAYPAHYTDDDLLLVALGLKPFARIIGREGDFIVTPGGERIQALGQISSGVRHLRRVQFIQHQPEQVEVRLDVEPAFGETERRPLLKHARTKIPPSIKLTLVTDQPLEVTHSGKTPFVIRTNS
jgi:phenylacetate-CoA ligase